MKVLFEPCRGLVLLKLEKEEKSDKPKIILDPKLEAALSMQKTPAWEIVASHPSNEFQVGDMVMFGADAGQNIKKALFPTSEGQVEFLMCYDNDILGKLIKEDATV